MDKSTLKKRVYNTGLVLLCALSLGASLHTIKEQTEIKKANNHNFVKLNKSLENTNKALETTQQSIQAHDAVVQKQIDELKK